MSRDVLVTSFSAEGADLYGRRCVDSWRHWPATVARVAYVDDPMALSVDTRATSHIVGWSVTRASLPESNPLAAVKPTNYIWNARRFAVKPFVWYDAAVRISRGHLIWLDGDTMTHSDVPEGFAAQVLDGADVAYLGRGTMHPETGAVVFRLPEALPLIRWCRHAYVMGGYARLDGWTDCHVFRAGIERLQVAARDLSGPSGPARWTSKQDAFALSPWVPYVRHLKGSRQKREALCVI